MSAIAIDTHVLLWLLFAPHHLSAMASQAIDAAVAGGHAIYVPAISLVEVRYLVERGRYPPTTLRDLDWAVSGGTAGLTVVPLDLDIAGAVGRVPRIAVPEMPDRIIAATALHLDVPLVTRDRALHAAPLSTIW